jgi:hypothetical protein
VIKSCRHHQGGGQEREEGEKCSQVSEEEQTRFQIYRKDGHISYGEGKEEIGIR